MTPALKNPGYTPELMEDKFLNFQLVLALKGETLKAFPSSHVSREKPIHHIVAPDMLNLLENKGNMY